MQKIENRYIIISFLPILFKCRESEFDSEMQLSKNKQSINGWSKYYPSLMKKIQWIKNYQKLNIDIL